MTADSLLPPNATPLERCIERVFAARLAALDTGIAAATDPATCPPAFLPWLAWQRSVDQWSPDWPTAIKRAVVADSLRLHRIKGTRGAVEQAVKSFGGSIIIDEWWQQDPPGTPGTFDLVMVATGADGQPVSAEMQQQIVDAVTEAKRLSQHFDLVIGQSVAALPHITPIIVAARFFGFTGNLATPLLRPIAGYAANIGDSNPYQWLPLQDASDTTAEDISGNARDGSYTGGYTLAEPVYPLGTVDLGEDSAQVDGIDGAVDTDLPSSLCDASFTAELFFRADSTATVSLDGFDQSIWYSQAEGGGYQILLGIDEGHIAIALRDADGIFDIARGDASLAADAFYNARLVHDSSAKTVRVLLSGYPDWSALAEEIHYSYDSLIAGDSAEPILLAATPGTDSPPLPQPFAGYLQHWRFWDSAIADTDALAVYVNEQGYPVEEI